MGLQSGLLETPSGASPSRDRSADGSAAASCDGSAAACRDESVAANCGESAARSVAVFAVDSDGKLFLSGGWTL